MPSTPLASIYVRISMDRTGESAGVARQEKECRKLCAKLGFEVGRVYVDNDRSATSGAPRPEFERLLADRPKRIIAWHQDRLLRLTSDLERVIALDAPVHTVEAGSLDLTTATGRAVARTVAAWSQHETELKAARQRAANDQRAESGAPYRCQRAFGYERDGVTIRESEAAELRAAAEGVLRGMPLNALVRDLNVRAIRTATGKTWRTTTLKAALLSPRNAGLRRHRGEVIGPGAWPAVFDEATAAALRAVLTDPSRARQGPPRRYLLSGTMRCGVCGGPITGAYVKEAGKGPTYRCLGHVSRQAARVDEIVEALVVARLGQPDALSLFTEAADEEAIGRLRDELAGARSRLDGLAEAFAMGDLDRQALTAGSRRLRDRAAEIEAQLAAAVTDPTLAEVASAADVAEAFAALPIEPKRSVVAQLLDLTLLPAGSGKRLTPATADEHLRLEWKGASDVG